MGLLALGLFALFAATGCSTFARAVKEGDTFMRRQNASIVVVMIEIEPGRSAASTRFAPSLPSA